MTASTTAPSGLLDRALAWLRQGTTQAGLQAIGLSALGYASHTTPLWSVVVAVPVGIAAMIWPEGASVQRQVQALATDAVQAVAAADPRIGSALGIGAPTVAAVAGKAALLLPLLMLGGGLAACAPIATSTQATITSGAQLSQAAATAAVVLVATHPGVSQATVQSAMLADAALGGAAGSLATAQPGTPAYAAALAALLAAYAASGHPAQ